MDENAVDFFAVLSGSKGAFSGESPRGSICIIDRMLTSFYN